MTEFRTWTDEEKRTYFNIISKPHHRLSVDEAKELTENVQYALIDFYRQTIDDSIRDAKPHGIWEKVKALFRS